MSNLENKSDLKKSNRQIVEDYLKSKYIFQNNEVLGFTEYSNVLPIQFKSLTDRFINSLLRDLDFNKIPCTANLLSSILNSNFVPKHNPFKDYFENLPAWDKTTDYISMLANTVITDNQEKWVLWFKKWICAMVACSIDPAVVNHQVIVLSGGQGVGKTTWSLNLIPHQLKKYTYSGTIKPDNKDTLAYLSECILVNMDELENLNRGEVGSLKELITKKVIKFRRPFATYSENFLRRASFIGSVNNSQFLTDTTGSRRFLCFEVSKINFEPFKDLDLVYSQAISLVKSGFKYYFDSEETKEVELNNQKYYITSREEELLLKHFEKGSLIDSSTVLITPTELVKFLEDVEKVKFGNNSQIKFGKILHKYGFNRVKSQGVYKYMVVQKNVS